MGGFGEIKGEFKLSNQPMIRRGIAGAILFLLGLGLRFTPKSIIEYLDKTYTLVKFNNVFWVLAVALMLLGLLFLFTLGNRLTSIVISERGFETYYKDKHVAYSYLHVVRVAQNKKSTMIFIQGRKITILNKAFMGKSTKAYETLIQALERFGKKTSKR